ncbi:MAG: hypothetical protein KDK91_10065, partial [Gammaproteobacteria bacterium]|nr:hypothetical protein [Gammaproteobacteria bacterium]
MRFGRGGPWSSREPPLPVAPLQVEINLPHLIMLDPRSGPASNRHAPTNPEDPPVLAFEGIKVADFTQVLSGPFATFQLGLLGA